MKHLSRLFIGFCFMGIILLAIFAMISILIILSNYVAVGIFIMFGVIMYLVGWELEVTYKKRDDNE